MYVIGHRGSAGTSPENTLASVREALRVGTEWLEIDIRFVDGEIFVIHDEALERTTDGRGSIYSLSQAQVRSLDAGCGEKIPTLEEMLAAIDAEATLNIELKDCSSLEPAYALVSSNIAKQAKWRGNIMFSTFEQSVHLSMAQALPESCMLGVLFDELPEQAIEYALRLNAYSLNLSYEQIKPELISQAHEAGLKVLVYTVNEQAHIRTCQSLKVDGIYTDFPERTRDFLDSNTKG